MEQMFGNESSEMLHLYLDGELDSANELSLFSELAQSDELRSEMKDFLAIRESVNNDIEAYTPPAEATKAVYTALGFSIPTNVLAPTIATTVVGTTLSVIFKKIWAPALAAVVATVLTTFIVSNINENKVDNNNSIPRMISKEVLTAENNNTNYISYNSENSVKSYSNSDNNVIHRNINTNHFKTQNSIVNDNSNSNIISDNPIIEESSKNLNISSLDKSDFADNFSLSNTNIVSNRNKGLQDYPINNTGILSPIIPLGTIGNKDVYLQLRGMNSFSFPSNSVPSKSNPFFTNMSIAVLFQKFGNFNVGIEFGLEQFAQEFYHTENNRTKLVKQNPMAYWGSIAIKGVSDYSITPLGEAHPYGQLQIGYSELGSLNKLIAGLQWNTSDYGLGMNLGVEGTLLVFDHQNKLYSTEKLGITYGLFYSF